ALRGKNLGAAKSHLTPGSRSGRVAGVRPRTPAASSRADDRGPRTDPARQYTGSTPFVRHRLARSPRSLTLETRTVQAFAFPITSPNKLVERAPFSPAGDRPTVTLRRHLSDELGPRHDASARRSIRGSFARLADVANFRFLETPAGRQDFDPRC